MEARETNQNIYEGASDPLATDWTEVPRYGAGVSGEGRAGGSGNGCFSHDVTHCSGATATRRTTDIVDIVLVS
ncbi:hypothetical protein E2C01_004382 [Portunus trituberculatus]|uniref:Uncharacterized protein n=1 Tax=Portunus trituberculatus TaxID=210409 RepID=A0A5B7CQJ2_PORTR|nr:hypothetical protein [Portunus trituberculatus]